MENSYKENTKHISEYPHDHTVSSLSLKILNKYHNNFFLETGSNIGEGIQVALNAGFKNIISIDVEEKYVNICKKRFADFPNVKVLLGDSSKDLFNIISEINEPITFWLDGHNYYSIPLVEELEQIKKHSIKNNIILIDDVRMFSTDSWNNLSQNTILNKIKEINNDYVFSYENSPNGENDILVANIKND